ncbi:MAG: FAD-dependent oxidoreductase, partial [Pseudomonadota bacterium]
MSRVAIIGGGVAGLSAAAALARDGHEVIVFETEANLGYHASGRSAAMFEENYGNATVRALNRVTAPVLEEMGVFSPRGILLVARAEESDRFHTD